MTKREIRELISEQFLCRVAFRGEKYPYIVPLHYVLLNDALYFHFSGYGRKMKLLESRRLDFEVVGNKIQVFRIESEESLRGLASSPERLTKRAATLEDVFFRLTGGSLVE